MRFYLKQFSALSKHWGFLMTSTSTKVTSKPNTVITIQSFQRLSANLSFLHPLQHDSFSLIAPYFYNATLFCLWSLLLSSVFAHVAPRSAWPVCKKWRQTKVDTQRERPVLCREQLVFFCIRNLLDTENMQRSDQPKKNRNAHDAGIRLVTLFPSILKQKWCMTTMFFSPWGSLRTNQ